MHREKTPIFVNKIIGGILSPLICSLLVIAESPATYAQTQATSSKQVHKAPLLTLEQVITSSITFHPLILAASAEIDAASGEYLSAKGAFDPLFKAESQGYAIGDYSGTHTGAGVEVPLEFAGAKIISGYRRSGGTFPIYENQYETNRTGEAQVGVEVPLLRDLIIDRRRSQLRKSEFQRVVAAANVEQRKIEMARFAQVTYWDWVASRHKYNAIKDLLDVALQRDKQLEVRVAKGDLPEFDRVDNSRAILQRKNQLFAAEQSLRRMELELSLLFRDGNGEPQDISLYAPPASFPLPLSLPAEPNVLIDQALAQRPELQRTLTQAEQNNVELDFAKNQFLPKVDALVMGARDYGEGSASRDEAELKLGMKIEIPLMMRTQEGRRASAQAKQRELRALQTHLQQKISTEVREAIMNLSLAKERITIAAQEVVATKELEQGERTRYELGDSNLIFVNLREQTAVDARLREIDAYLDYWRAQAQLRAAIGSTTLS